MPQDTLQSPAPAKRSTKQRWIWLAAGLLLGALLVLAIRFATYNTTETHYHANFAVYINGQRETFKDSRYYQEVNICDLRGTSPLARTHMHNQENGVIHVHDDAVTWGQFFENLGWYVGPDFIRTATTLYQVNDTSKLNIVRNGDDLTDLTTITNEVIKDKDRLLLSYGPVDQAVLSTEYKSVPATAASYNARKDPAGCGSHEAPSATERLKHLF